MRLFLFDCDGTLVDSQHVICAAMALAFQAAGLRAPSREQTLGIVGLSLPEAMQRLAPAADALAVCALVTGYREAHQSLRGQQTECEPLYPGAIETVRALADRDDVTLGIATGKSRRGVDALIERTGLADVFQTVQTADSAPSKPHPRMIEQAMAEVGADRIGTTMIGDTSYDMEMARNAGVTGIGVTWGYHPRRLLMQSGANAIATDFPELLRLVDQPMLLRAAS